LKAADRILTVNLEAIPPEGEIRTGEVSTERLGLAGTTRAEFDKYADFRLELSVVKGKLLARGEASVRYQARCDRCLKTFADELAVEDFCRYFDETDAENIDLTGPLREDMLLGFPQRLLCGGACRGLCPQCGANLNEGGCGCTNEVSANGPWGVLDALDPDTG
jgi:uncharacterized protein